MAVTSETLHQTQIPPSEAEPEPELVEIVQPVERLLFDAYEKFVDYKKYLGSLVGESVTISARVTHKVAELTGLLVTRSEPVDLRAVNGEILGVNESYVTFQCRGEDDEAAIYTTLAIFVHLHTEED